MDVPGPKTRKDARMVALQVLYAVETASADPEGAFSELVHGGDDRHREFARTLIHTTHRNRRRMDALIAGKSQRWNLDRMALIDHLILRMALCELFYVDDVPPKVTINEAIELGKDFSTEQSGRFINGILDAIFNENEQEILRGKKPGAATRPGGNGAKKKRPRPSGASKPPAAGSPNAPSGPDEPGGDRR